MKNKRITYTGIGLVVLALAIVANLTYVNHREIRILSVKISSERLEVEEYIGKGRVDISGPACGKCFEGYRQFVYNGNPSLWFGRLEDSLVICYIKDKVCDINRGGL